MSGPTASEPDRRGGQGQTHRRMWDGIDRARLAVAEHDRRELRSDGGAVLLPEPAEVELLDAARRKAEVADETRAVRRG